MTCHVPFNQFPPRSHAQKLQCNITSKILTLIQFAAIMQISPVLPVLICTYVCLALCHFITCIGSFIYHQDQNTEYLATQGCLLLPFHSPISHPWKPLICPLLLKFCHFKKYYKWTHTACSLWELAFFTEPKFPGGPSQPCVSAAHPFLLLSSNPWCGCPRFVQPFTH